MAIAVGSRNNGNKSTSASQVTWSHTIAAGTDRILLVPATCGSGASDHSTSAVLDPSGLNLSMTLAGRIVAGSGGTGFSWAELYYLIAPPVGTYTIAVNSAAGVEHAHGSVDFTGVDQTTPFNAAGPHLLQNTASGGSPLPSATITTAVDQWMLAVACDDDAATGTIPSLADAAGQTRIFYQDVGNSFHQGAGADKAGAGTSGSISWTSLVSATDRWAVVGVSLRPSVAPGSPKLLTVARPTFAQRRG